MYSSQVCLRCEFKSCVSEVQVSYMTRKYMANVIHKRVSRMKTKNQFRENQDVSHVPTGDLAKKQSGKLYSEKPPV